MSNKEIWEAQQFVDCVGPIEAWINCQITIKPHQIIEYLIEKYNYERQEDETIPNLAN